MNRTEMVDAITAMGEEIRRRDALLRRCFFAVRQVHSTQMDRLLADMAEWRPAMPREMQPKLGRKET